MLEIIEIVKMESALNVALKTRYRNYNSIKNYIASMYSTMDIQKVETTRKIGEFLGISKSIVARVLLQLEEDGFISKVRVGTHPKYNWYVVRISKQECFLYRNFYSLSPFRKKKFLRNLETCGAKTLDELVKMYFGMGADYYAQQRASGE